MAVCTEKHYSYFDGATKIGTPFENRCSIRPAAIQKKTHHPALVHKKEMLPTIHQRIQVDGSYEYRAVLVLLIDTSYIYTKNRTTLGSFSACNG